MSVNEKPMSRYLIAGVVAACIVAWPLIGGAVEGHDIAPAGRRDVFGQRYAQAEQKPVDTSPPAGVSPPVSASPAQPSVTPQAPPAAQPPAVALPQPAAKSATETPAVVMNGQQVVSILGKKVRGADGTDMGRIVDIIADKSGQLRAAIIDFGGFLGVGSRQIAVDWNAIRFPPDGKVDSVEVDLTRDQLRVAPAYKPGEQIVVLGQPSTVGVRTNPPSADAAKPSVKGSPPK